MFKQLIACLMICAVALLLPAVGFAQDALTIYAPPTPSSIPVILAAQQMENAEITIFTNHSQAHTLFLRDDIQMLVTGLSVGINFFRREVPAQMVNSYVRGVTDLITRDRAVSSFQELRGQEIYLPFEGSPIEEITAFFVEREGLSLHDDFKVVYAPFASSLELLKQGKVAAVVMPQPLATIAAAQENMFRSFSYKNRWDTLTDSDDGYPQVGTFVKASWAAAHGKEIARFHEELEKALQLIAQNPQEAVARTKSFFKFPEALLLASLKRSAFSLNTSRQLKHEVSRYYEIIGSPLDDTFDAFFYIDSE